MAKLSESAKERAILARRRRSRQALGFAICVLTLVGTISVITSSVKLVAKAFDNTEEKLAYEQQLGMIVAIDPVPFDSLAEANINTLKDAAMWQTVANMDVTTAERDDMGSLYLPKVEFSRVVADLYGPNFEFPYETFESRGLTYNWVEDKEAYLVPITSVTTDFIPSVTKIKNKSGKRYVTVGYISKYTEGGEFSMTTNNKPVKYYDYEFTKQDGKYYLTAILESETKPEISSSAASSSSVVTEEFEAQIKTEE